MKACIKWFCILSQLMTKFSGSPWLELKHVLIKFLNITFFKLKIQQVKFFK